jgi:hypothetical protein
MFDPLAAVDDHVAVMKPAGDCKAITSVAVVDDQVTTVM